MKQSEDLSASSKVFYREAKVSANERMFPYLVGVFSFVCSFLIRKLIAVV